MSENSQDSLQSLAQQHGLNLLTTLFPAGFGPKPKVNLWHLIQAAQKPLSGRESLLDAIPQYSCSKGADSKVAEIVASYTRGEPGFSNKLKAPYDTKEVTTMLARLDVVAATICDEQARDEDYMRHIINKDVARNFTAFCEDQFINGDGKKIKGLLHDSRDTTVIDSKGSPTRLVFYPRALKKYASIAGRRPSLIVLPNKEMLDLAELLMGEEPQGFPEKLFGIPVMASDFLPDDRGLILAVDEIVLVSSSLESNFEARNHDQVEVSVGCNLGLLVKRPETVAQLIL